MAVCSCLGQSEALGGRKNSGGSVPSIFLCGKDEQIFGWMVTIGGEIAGVIVIESYYNWWDQKGKTHHGDRWSA